MSKVFFEDGPMNLMERFMDLAVQRQSLISGNLANVDTPGYKTVDIDFEQELQSAIGQEGLSTEVTNVRHFSKKVDIEEGATGSPREVDGLTLRNDMNNVNIDREMAEMSTNGLKFSTVAQLIEEKFRILKSAVLEGR
jgi:flagellar basal-body rod protein FlgB